MAKEYDLTPVNTTSQQIQYSDLPEKVWETIKITNYKDKFPITIEYKDLNQLNEGNEEGSRVIISYNNFSVTTSANNYNVYAPTNGDESGLTAYSSEKESDKIADIKLDTLFKNAEWTYDAKTNQFTYVTKSE